MKNIHTLEKEGKMLVPGIVLASDDLFEKISQDKTLEQVKNVAQLPGIVEKSLAMPDAHQGYGFPVGGVAAFDPENKGIISPGGIGYDINCGVRLLRTNLTKQDFLKKRTQVIKEINAHVPSGVGRGSSLKLSDQELDEVLSKGSQWCAEKNYATQKDIAHTENNGCIENANPKKVSQRAKARGRNQLGTIGAGNHFVEIQFIEKISNAKTAEAFGLKKDQVVILIHTGSRGLGHQTASDYIQKMEKLYGYEHLPDRELACAPIKSDLGQDYLAAMAAAANFAFANRQIITHKIRQAFKEYFPNIKTEVVYDVAHNIAKFEKFTVENKKKELCIHRKGATRSFGPGRKELPKDYHEVGQPVFIPGSMGTSSYVLVGTKEAENISFASTAHGAGRVMSRTKAKQTLTPEQVKNQLKQHNVEILAGSQKGMVEEAPEAYKDVDEVVRISDELGISKIVAQLKPLAVIKG
jgi:tRNA-splicing ligase RtcB (3'-phosphate/5'-hydroxy nucleic acid ligase)